MDDEREAIVATSELGVEALEVIHWAFDTWDLSRLFVFWDVGAGAYYGGGSES